MSFLLILAIFFWLGGYFITTRTMSNTGLLSEDLEKIITPPTWLYYLCGAPGNKEYPRGAMRVVAFRAQITGIALVIFLICSKVWKFSRTEYLIGLTLTFLVAYVLTSCIPKKYFVREQIRVQIKNKKENSMTPTKITDDLSYSIEGDSVNFYSEFGSNGGANLTVELDEIDAIIEALQNIKATLQNGQTKANGE